MYQSYTPNTLGAESIHRLPKPMNELTFVQVSFLPLQEMKRRKLKVLVGSDKHSECMHITNAPTAIQHCVVYYVAS